MEYGLAFFPTPDAIDPASLARAAEQRGFSSLLFTEHTHIPVSRQSPFPGGGQLPRKYSHTLDPFVALTAAATVTERIQVGTGVCLVVERDAIITAKEVASLDLLSAGRFVFGVGAGWNREEMANHGTDPRTRMDLLEERMQAMREIWTKEEPEFHGRFVDFDPIWSYPKPVQRPYPPVLVGGMGPTVEDRILRFGDGWIALRVDEDNIDEFAARVGTLQQRARDAGRDTVPVWIFGGSRDPRLLERYEAAGVTQCLFMLPSEASDAVLRKLDQTAELIG